MKKEQISFLFGGFAFGILFGFALSHAIQERPELSGKATTAAEMAMPQGPPAPTQMGGPPSGPSAPMMATINALKQRLQDDPRDLEAVTRLAYFYHDAAMPQQARGYYERAIELKPADPDLQTDLGICYRALGQYEQALERFSRAQELAPGHWQSLFNTALVAAFDVGRFDLAMDSLQKLDALDPRPPELAAHLGQLRQALERARSEGGEARGDS